MRSTRNAILATYSRQGKQVQEIIPSSTRESRAKRHLDRLKRDRRFLPEDKRNVTYKMYP